MDPPAPRKTSSGGGMNEIEFYGWQVAWYVFGTLASFVAALLFWNKGTAVVAGNLPKTYISTWKLTGAAAIFIVVLGAFYFINPLKPLSDYKRVLVIYDARQQASDAGAPKSGTYTIQADVFKDVTIDPKSVVIEMFPTDSLESLLPGLDNRSFSTQHSIPAGTYTLRVIERDSGRFRDFTMEVPPGPTR